MFEIEDQSDTAFAYTEVIQHLSAFMIGNAVNHFGIDDDGIEDEKIRVEFTDVHPPKQHGKSALLIKGDATQAKGDSQCILINLLVKPMGYLVQDVERTPNNPLSLGF